MDHFPNEINMNPEFQIQQQQSNPVQQSEIEIVPNLCQNLAFENRENSESSQCTRNPIEIYLNSKQSTTFIQISKNNY